MVHLKLTLRSVTTRVRGFWSCRKQHHEKHLDLFFFLFTFEVDLITLRIRKTLREMVMAVVRSFILTFKLFQSLLERFQIEKLTYRRRLFDL